MDLDALYREHAPAIVASLVKSFGPARLDLVEAAVQEAFLSAIEAWPDKVPERPAAWLHAVAKRRTIDALRRAAWFSPDASIEDAPATASEAFGDEDLLKMMLVCCHPAIPVEGALALALRTLCGFPIPALCRALLAEESAVEKRLARARQTLRDEKVEFEPGPDAASRVDAVSRTLYVLFLEGYSAHAGAAQIDEDLCATAIRLGALLVGGFPSPRTHALQALFLLQASRLPARVDEHGEIIPLHAQDRSRWNRALIDRALEHLAAASVGPELSPYHLEAAIAACHALAPKYADTDWSRIVGLYDKLLALQPSPVVALQRAIAIGRAQGPKRGLAALGAIPHGERLEDSPVLAAAAGELKRQLGDRRGARAAFRRALELAGTEPERRFLDKQLAELED